MTDHDKVPQRRICHGHIVAFDPSATALGIAVAQVTHATTVCKFNRSVRLLPAPLRVGIFQKSSFFAHVSMTTMTEAVERSSADGLPLFTVVEVPSGKVHAGRHGGGGSGLSVYGFAAGLLVGALVQARAAGIFSGPIFGVTAERWTGGHGKAKRQRVAARRCAWYDAAKDPGGDEADAICLADWFSRTILPLEHPERDRDAI